MKKGKILICDDEIGVRESLNLILDNDYELSFAVDGEEALTKAKAEPVDLVILDIKMPKIDGIGVLKELRPTKPRLEVLILTGYQSVEIAKETVRYGAVGYITKPFETEQILNTVKEILEKKVG